MVDLTRRSLLFAIAAAPALLGTASAEALASPGAGRNAAAARARFLDRIASLERTHGGRLGVSALGPEGAPNVAHRGGERFLLCSTFKALSVALVLQRVDRGDESLSRAIPVHETDLVSYSPITGTFVGKSMTIAELCHAAITVSDNTAGNLLFASYGGPPALTRFLRGVGDRVTRLDRIETALNAWEPSHRDWDTTTPDAIARTLRTLLTGNVLSHASRGLLQAWLRASTTGKARLRAGVPADWMVGDKTGTGPTSTNDIAWIQPPRGPALAVAVYYADAPGDVDAQNAVIAEVARAVVALVADAVASPGMRKPGSESPFRHADPGITRKP